MSDKRLRIGMIGIEIDIICNIKHFREIVNDVLIIKFNSKSSATKAYNKYIYSRYFGKKLWDYRTIVEKNNNIITIKLV